MKLYMNARTQVRAKILLVFSIVLCFTGCGTRNDKPHAVVEPSEISIKTSSTEPSEKLEFRIRNKGAKPFNVLHVTASCGCTSADVHPKLILPGKDAILTATVNPINSGSTRIAVEVITDIPEQPTLSVFINNTGTGKVPYIASNSNLISFGTNAKQGDAITFYIDAMELASDKPWINPPLLEFDGIEIRGGLTEESPVGNGVVERHYEYTAHIVRNLAIGEFRNHVVVTGHSDKLHQEIRIPIHGSVAAPVKISPEAVFGSYSKFEEIPEYTITFQDAQKTTAFKIEPPTEITNRFAIEKLNESNGISIFRIRIKEEFGKQLDDELVFRTNVAEMPEIRLPVILRLRD